ncbi:hepatic lectin-like [Hypanus sabinus]|uniref:hepatic lectin-like n=1 Tax=Hypanus sabinus TaxID=79690 RepID=UPI0028C4176C|nr:hepatic lectin-like [Hypanus sabinus]
MFFSQVGADAKDMDPSNNYELTEDSFQLGKWKTGFRGPRAEPIQGKFFPWIICALLIVSLLMSVVTLGIVVKLKHSKMTNGSLAKLQSDVTRLMEQNSEMISSSLAKLQSDISRLMQSVKPIRSLNTWRFFNQREYYFTSTRNRWKEAQQFCVSMDSNLVVINSREEQEYIRMNVNLDYWIGLHDIVEEGNWRWVDGTDYASNVKFWERGQPNVHEEFEEDCVVVSGNGLWHDWPCDSMHFAICEKTAA